MSVDDGIQFDDIERIFAARDKRAAIDGTSALEPAPRPRQRREPSSAERGAGRYERTPRTDEFTPSRKLEPRRNTSVPERNASPSRNKGGKRLQSKHQTAGIRLVSSKRKSGKYSVKHHSKHNSMKLSTLVKILSVLGVGTGAIAGIVAALAGGTPNAPANAAELGVKLSHHEPQAIVEYSDCNPSAEQISIDGTDYLIDFDKTAKAIQDAAADGLDIGVSQEAIVDIISGLAAEVSTSESAEAEAAQRLDERLNEIFANDPDAKTAFDDIQKTLDNMTNDLGEDAMEFIRQTRDNFAPKVSLPMLACVFQLESKGHMWDEYGNLLLGTNGDAGFGQITPICEIDVNGRLNPDGKIRHKEDPHDNVEMTAIALQYHCGLWGFDVNGDDGANLAAIPYALSSYNMGEGGVREHGIRKTYVKECFDNHLSYLLEYPEFCEYFGCKDFID